MKVINERDSGFDILSWWKINGSKIRVLAQIARDVLTILVSIVTFEFTFSIDIQINT